ncbi:MAG TPA: glycerophosphodiester phosphodiesterase [Vicinamibacterales bacterium]|nr:glycerophosphodiester phosphodiesterase [Vicinamibacterales bacterium]
MSRFVYAHRGGAALAPENTMAAFERGMAEGADGLEFDVRLSRDGVPVVHHDPTLERTTDARGPVSALTADELARVDAGSRFTDDAGRFVFRGQGIGVPTLDEVVRRFPSARLIVEMKDDTEAIADAVVNVLRKADALDRADIASFYARPVLEARRLGGGVRTGASQQEVRAALYAAWCGLSPRKPAYFGFQIPERAGRLRIVSRRFVRCVSRAGLSVAVWVVDDEAHMRRLLDWGVTGVITDRPDIAVPLLKGLDR